jgi:hypothetical protein
MKAEGGDRAKGGVNLGVEGHQKQVYGMSHAQAEATKVHMSAKEMELIQRYEQMKAHQMIHYKVNANAPGANNDVASDGEFYSETNMTPFRPNNQAGPQ